MSSAFTPLEALLLFQYLSNYGVAPTVFTKISDLLNADDQIRRSASYDAARLSPDALRDFYLRLLKDEARSELGAAVEGTSTSTTTTTSTTATINGDASSQQSGATKRKAPSPSLPTIQEASRDAHLIPQLIRKLYARYREHAIIEIREDERRYERLQRSIGEIKSGAWDERLQREIERGEWDTVIQRKAARSEDAEADASVTRDGSVNGAVKQPPAVKVQEDANAAAGAVWKPEPDLRSLGPLSQPTTPAASPHQARPPYQQPPPSQPPAISPRQPTQLPIYPAPGPSSQQGQYVQPQPPLAISPRPPDARSATRHTQSPMLPPPPPLQSGQPLPPYPYANNMNAQQLPPHSPYAPPLPGQLAQTQHGSPGGYQQYGQHQSPYPPFPGVQGGVMLQPFAVAPQTPTRSPQQDQPAPTVPNLRAGAMVPAPSSSLSTQVSTGMSPFDIAKLLATPLSAKKLSLSLGPAAPSPSKDTQWKALPGRAGRGQRKSSPTRPQSRSVSPISERAASPPPEEETARRSRRGKPAGSVQDGTTLSRSTRIRRARGASTTSSVPGSSVRGRTRSQSVLSHAEDVSMADAASVTGRRVKHEPSTPMESSDIVHPTIESTPGQTARRAIAAGNKRKRGTRDDSETSDALLALAPPVPSHPRQDKSVVLANKNFGRLSATIMNDIQSHKHASLFGNPVRDRDAEGYSDIIRRPQDLKSIRTAITAGSRAVTAATASESFASSTASSSQPSSREGGIVVVLPAAEDLVPPRAIVNSGQLEKEVLRMFANAVMFNPGEDDDGVVRDAREMAASVEAQIAKFREVERSSAAAILPLSATTEGASRANEAREEDDLAESGIGKRRKVG